MNTKFDVGQRVTYPAKEAEPAESNPEPVKLYCFKDCFPGEWFTKGKVYETDCNDKFTTDDGYQPDGCEWRENYGLGDGHWSDFLVPLVQKA